MHARKAALVSLLLATAWPLTPAVHASENPWFDAFVAYHESKGTAYTVSTDAGILAWQESLMLRAYLNVYEATKDPTWLDTFATHLVTVLDAADDLDGDGYREWTSARYSPDLVTTGGFKFGEAGDPTLPLGWLRHGSTNTTVFRTDATGEFVGGSCPADTWGVELVTAGGTAQRLYQDLGTYVPGHRHQLSLYARNSGISVHGRAFVYNRTTNSVLASIEVTGTTWKNYVADFTTPALAGHDLEIWLAHLTTTPAAQSAFFDLVRVSGYHAYHVLDGMIGIPMAHFVRLVRQNPSAFSVALQDAADTYEAFLHDHLIPKWEDPAGYYGNTWIGLSATEGYYREPAGHDTFSSGTAFVPLPYNQYFALLEVQHILATVDPGLTTYRTKAEQGATYFLNRVALNGAAYTWFYAGFPDSKIEDASHVNVDMEFITELHRAQHVFDDTDMERFTATLIDNLWNGSLTDPQLNNQVTGDQGTYCQNYLFSPIMYGWLPYAQFDSFVWDIAAQQYAGEPVANHTAAVTLSQILKWDPVKVVNQGFELPALFDPTLPARWTRSLSTPLTAFRDSANQTSGACGLTVISNGTSFQRLVQPWEKFVGGESYTVTFDGRTDGSGAGGRVLVYNATTATIIAAYNFSNTTWQTHTFTFTAPTDDEEEVNLQLGHLNYAVSGGQTHYDNVSIKRTGDLW